MTSKRKAGTKSKAVTNKLTLFHERFEIDVGISEARRRFVNRVKNYIFENFLEGHLEGIVKPTAIRWQVSNAPGEEYVSYHNLAHYARGDFYRTLQVIEAAYSAIEVKTQKSMFNGLINMVLDKSEIDLGISWQPPTFVHTGAKLLGMNLVNEPLRWLSDPKYRTVYEPFEKGLSHFLEAEKKPFVLPDVITDMYEALEALSKVKTGRETRDLSANAESLIKSIGASEHYRQILKDYISYANQFRHAAKQSTTRPKRSIAEVESFIYLTGLFVRIAIQK